MEIMKKFLVYERFNVNGKNSGVILYEDVSDVKEKYIKLRMEWMEENDRYCEIIECENEKMLLKELFG